MKGRHSCERILLVLASLLFFVCVLSPVADAQGLPGVPGQSNPSNDCGCPRGDDTIPVSSGMFGPYLPRIPNLELGFLYYFGNNVRTGRFTADYVLPVRLSSASVLFGEAHAEGWDFWKRPSVSGSSNNRVDISFGGGYRTMLGAKALMGVNGFYDTSRLYNRWYSSGGVGLEYAANVAGDDAIDLNFNWYGNLFNQDVLINAFRNKGNSFDLEAGYSHALFDHALDLRLKLIGYQFDIGNAVYGWRCGADLTTRDGVFTVRYEYGHDRIDGYYNTVGGFVNVGFQLENLLSGETPFTFPEPVFRSPRNLWRLLGQKVKRNWHQPEAVVVARSYPNPPPACTNLEGLIARQTIIMNDEFLFAGFVPAPLVYVPVTIKFCWCGLQQQDTVVSLAFWDGGGFRVDYVNVPVRQVSDCVTLTRTSTYDGLSPKINRMQIGMPFDPSLSFAPGGGISVLFISP
jgi:hypothetical protein